MVLSPYWDSGHVLSLWFGHTAAAGLPNPSSWWGRLGTIEEAVAQFISDIAPYVAGVGRAFTVALTQAQFDAAFDFNYNTGAIETAHWVDLVNAGDLVAAEQSFAQNWRAPADRRQVERALFFKGVYSRQGPVPLYPADARGNVEWSKGRSIDIRPYLPSRELI